MKTKQLETSGALRHGHAVRRRGLRAKANRTGGLTGWDTIEKLVGTVPGPEDWAAEHDHYLRGTPKRNQGLKP